jgi:hypothetical protein
MPRTPLFTLLTTLSFLAAGCQPAAPPASRGGPVTTPPPATVEAGHEGHDHSAHGHPTEGPHHGALVELGNEEYHAEVVHDDATGTVTVYLLDSHAEKTVTTTATQATINLKHGDSPEQYKLAAQPEEGNPAGQTSRFTLTDKELVKHLDEVASAAKFNITIGDTPYSGVIPADDHAAHGHDHAGGADALVWRKTVTAHGFQIQLGHHGTELHAGTKCEPAVSITRDGQPVAEAKVYNSLRSGDGSTVEAAEVATTYEPATAAEPAHYAQGGLTIPKDVKQVTLQFRIVLPSIVEEVVETVSVPIH